MNPYERRLRDEVIYLHSLWHLGPPIRQPPFKPNPQFPYHNPNPITNPSRSIGVRTNDRKRQRLQSDLPPDSGKEWPCKKSIIENPPAMSGWPTFKPQSAKASQPISSEKQKELAAVRIQQKGLDACCKFFEQRVDSDSDEEYEDGDEENEEFMFFLRVFVEDNELRSYYEKNYEGGEFCCLVCGGIGKKVWKRFKDCVGLVQHSAGISNTKKKRAHRAFGQVICKVLGWDRCRLPSIVKKGDPLSCILARSEELQAVATKKDDSHSEVLRDNVETLNANNGESPTTEGSSRLQTNGESIICENSLKEDDDHKHIGDSHKKISDVGVNEGVEDCPGSGIEWPCEKPVNESPTEMLKWPTLKPQSAPVTPLFSAEELVRISAEQLQQKVSEVCREFFAGNANSNSDENDQDEFEESEEYKFFFQVFVEDSQLRAYYENNFEAGEFCCLVCGGIGKKVWKRFKGCIGLLQHSNAILKTKKKKAHRAYGRVICKVLGWDIKRLPTIVLLGDSLSRSLEKSGSEVNTSGNKDESSLPIDNVNSVNGESVLNEASDFHDIMTISKNPFSVNGVDNHSKEFADTILDMGVNRIKAINSVNSLNDDDVDNNSKGVDEGTSDMGVNEMGATNSSDFLKGR